VEPLDLVYLAILGGGFTFGFIRIIFFRRTRKIREQVVGPPQSGEADFPAERVEMLEAPERPRIDIEWHNLNLPDVDFERAEPPVEEPPEGENAVTGEDGRVELHDLRKEWIEINKEAFDEGAESIIASISSEENIEVVSHDEEQGDEFHDRIEREGAMTGSVQVTLLWDNYNDLDLHVFCASGERIYFNNRTSECGGDLDIDMNIKPSSRKPIENIFWKYMPPDGEYRICIHHYARHRRWKTKDPTKFSVRVQIGDEVNEYNGSITKGDPMLTVTKFVINNAQDEKKDTIQDEKKVDTWEEE
jgi:hypothetical protein